MPEIPADAKRPQDHKAAKAEAEAATPDGVEEPTIFEWRGQTYSIDPEMKDDVEILEDFEDGHNVRALRRVLGQKQWDEFKNANRGPNGRVKSSLTDEFLTELLEVLGQGN